MAAQPPPPRREAPPSTTEDPFKDQWDQLRPQLRSWWDRLTEADLMAIDGQKDRLISTVQQRYGYAQERAQQEVERRLQESAGRTAGVAATVTSAAQDAASRVAETAGTAASKAQEMAGTAATTAQEMAGSAATAVTDAVSGVRSYVQEKGVQALPGDLEGLIRRHPIPALLIGLGIGWLLIRTLGKASTTEGA